MQMTGSMTEIHWISTFIGALLTPYCPQTIDALLVFKIVSQTNRIVYFMHILQKSAWIFQRESGC